MLLLCSGIRSFFFSNTIQIPNCFSQFLAFHTFQQQLSDLFTSPLFLFLCQTIGIGDQGRRRVGGGGCEEYSLKGKKSELSGKGTEEGRRVYAEGGRVKPEFEVIPYPKPPKPNGLWKEDMGMGIAKLAEEGCCCCVREFEVSSSLTRSKSLTALANSSPFIPSNNN